MTPILLVFFIFVVMLPRFWIFRERIEQRESLQSNRTIFVVNVENIWLLIREE
ncbi:MAG: hypothetical protein ACLRQR_03880 [Merdimonas faecis]|uniref:hypothetical protein n=1 Tax=Merdimonas faecis TaxID=1653435 RepID=UPI0039905F46